jgi:hypothetical protein
MFSRRVIMFEKEGFLISIHPQQSFVIYILARGYYDFNMIKYFSRLSKNCNSIRHSYVVELLLVTVSFAVNETNN